MRICVIGDELIAGAGDPRGLGWVGRVIARSQFDVPPLVMTLPMPGENSQALSERWEAEVLPRLHGDDDVRLVVAPGVADLTSGLSLPRTRLYCATIADQAAKRSIPTMFVGPAPLAGIDSASVAELSRAVSDVASRRDLPFVNCCDPLIGNEQWFEDMATSSARSSLGHTLPGQAGYGLLAWLVLHQGWYEWTGSELRA